MLELPTSVACCAPGQLLWGHTTLPDAYGAAEQVAAKDSSVIICAKSVAQGVISHSRQLSESDAVLERGKPGQEEAAGGRCRREPILRASAATINCR